MRPEKPHNTDDDLAFMSPRLREMLRRIAHADRRLEGQELIWLIENRLQGRLVYTESHSITPLASLNDLPAPLIEKAILVQRDVSGSDKDSEPPNA